MKVFLDDVRNPPDDSWVVLRSYAEFVDFLTCDHCLGPDGLSQITAMSLDHDLGADCERCWLVVDDGNRVPLLSCGGSTPYMGSGQPEECRHGCTCHKTGYDCVTWMEQNDRWPPCRPSVHSMNPVGRQRMEQVIRFRYNED